MAKINVGIPQGTRDFGPDVVRKRNYIFNTIKRVFELYGFEPLETPAIEKLETLTGKYGEEGDKLIFKIINNGLEQASKHNEARIDFEKILEGKNVSSLTERALKYDLTIPFARYVAMNHAQLTFPFKRYQMQPVWRADRPQKGRYREFYQCDADIVGSRSLLNEIELINIYHEVLTDLKINFELKINSRQILAGLSELCGGSKKLTDITTAIDKLSKIGLEKVKDELVQRGLNDDNISLIEKYLSIDGSNDMKIAHIKKLFVKNKMGQAGIKEIEFILNSELTNDASKLKIDFTLARGLDYYTGLIIEAQAPAVKIGSIGGGGRYDDLTGLFGVPDIPGVGISFGVDRIYDVMEQLNVFPADVYASTQLLFFNLGETESKTAYKLMQQMREKGVRCEIYHESAKFDKQFKYAEKKKIAFVAIIGSKEVEANNCMLKDLRTGKQQSVSFNELLSFDFNEE